jgi:hypothetical protein
MNESSTNQLQASTKSASNEEIQRQLSEYLNKFIDLVPNLKNFHNQEPTKSSINLPNELLKHATNEKLCEYAQELESLKNLEINSANDLSDLQILQSVLDYISDLKQSILNETN